MSLSDIERKVHPAPTAPLPFTPSGRPTPRPQQPFGSEKRGFAKRHDLIRWLLKTLTAVHGGAKLTRQDAYGPFEVLRFDLTDGSKSYRPIHSRRQDGGLCWFLGYPPGPRRLFHVNQIETADLVLVVEGEKCVEAAEALGAAATCCPGGARAAGKADWAPLAGRTVAIVPDADKAGSTYAADVAAILSKMDGTTVKIVELPGLGPKEDIADWTGTADELQGLIDSVPLWTPPVAETSRPRSAPRSDHVRFANGDSRQQVDSIDLERFLDETIGPADRSRRRTCPFHDDTRPSLTTFQGKDGRRRYQCFVCGAGGDVVDFVRETEHLNFPDALERLGVTLAVASSAGGDGANVADSCYGELQGIAAIGDIVEKSLKERLFERFPRVDCEIAGFGWYGEDTSGNAKLVPYRCHKCEGCRQNEENRAVREALQAAHELGGALHVDVVSQDDRRTASTYARRQAQEVGEDAAHLSLRQSGGAVVYFSRHRVRPGDTGIVDGVELEDAMVAAVRSVAKDGKKAVNCSRGWPRGKGPEGRWFSLGRSCSVSVASIVKAAKLLGKIYRCNIPNAPLAEACKTLRVGPFLTGEGTFDHDGFQRFADDAELFQAGDATKRQSSLWGERPPPGGLTAVDSAAVDEFMMT